MGLSKTATKYSWKYQGIKFESDDDFNYWYDRYRSAVKCEVTGLPFGKGMEKKCLDHDHTTGKPLRVIIGWLNTVRERLEDKDVYYRIGVYMSILEAQK